MGLLVDIANDRIENLTQIKTFADYSDSIPDISSFHSHECNELVICKTPAAVIYCGEEAARAGGNIVVFNPAREMHTQLNQPHSHYWRFRVEYPADYLEGVLPAETQFHHFFCLAISDADLESLMPYVDVLWQTQYDPESVWKDNRQKYLCALLVNELFCCMDKMSETAKTPIMYRDRQIYSICRYIHLHYREKITLETLSEEFFISHTTLTRRFRKIVGMSVNEYVQKVRCDYGAQALKAGRSVQDTAELCGYKDVSFFIRIFEGLYGASPKQYGKSLNTAKNDSLTMM